MHLLRGMQYRNGRTMPQLRRGAGTQAAARGPPVNYRHAYHAGNFADVVKHIALCAVLLHLKKKEKGFCVVDSHAGAGLYEIKGAEATRTKEAERGIGSLLNLSADGLPLSLATYLEWVRAEGEGHYPGSPRLAARLLRPQDRLIAIEMHPREEILLARALKPFPNAKSLCADGYERVPALLPPPERRGAILIDPPYEAPDEFERVSRVLVEAHRRFTAGIYLVWFPVKSKAAADRFCGEVLTRGIARAVRVDADVGGGHDRLGAAGLLVVNAPYGFDEEMRAVSSVIAPLLGKADGFAARIATAKLGSP